MKPCCWLTRPFRGRLLEQSLPGVKEADSEPRMVEFLPVSLEWTTGDETTDIQPRGQREVVLQRVIVMGEDAASGSFIVSPNVFNASPLEFTLEVLIEGKRRDELRFRLEHAWPSVDLYAESEKYPHDPFPYPTITPVAQRGRSVRSAFSFGAAGDEHLDAPSA